jgi:hypothetical protein
MEHLPCTVDPRAARSAASKYSRANGIQSLSRSSAYFYGTALAQRSPELNAGKVREVEGSGMRPHPMNTRIMTV